MSLERIIRPFESAGLAYPFMPAGYVETEMANVRLELGKGGGTVVNLLSAGQQSHGSVMDETERETGTRPDVKAPPKPEPEADDEEQQPVEQTEEQQGPIPYDVYQIPTDPYQLLGNLQNLDANGNLVLPANDQTTPTGPLVPPGPNYDAGEGGSYTAPGTVSNSSGGGGEGGWSTGSAGSW